MFASAILLVLSLLALVSTHVTADPPEFHILPYGRRISVSAIRTHAYAARKGYHPHQLYEISEYGLLIGGINISIALKKDTVARQLKYHPSLTITVNGRPLSTKFNAPTVRSGPDFEAVYANGDEFPTAISLGNIDLAPFHFAEHPGVYIAPASGGKVGSTSMLRGNSVLRDSKSQTKFFKQTDALDSGAGLEMMPMLESSSPSSRKKLDFNHARKIKSSESKRGAGAARTLNSNILAVDHQTGGGPKCGAGDRRRFYEVAVAIDNTLCARYGNSVSRSVTEVQRIIYRSNGAFSGSCLRLALVHVEANCLNRADPYAKTKRRPIAEVLNNFQAVWRRSRTGVRRDVALLITGYTNPTDFINYAFVKSSCSLTRGFATSEQTDPRTVSGALVTTLGTQGNSRIVSSTPLKLPKDSILVLRAYLTFNPNSRCITTARRFCSRFNCRQGTCVAGKCVANTVRLTSCAASFSSTRALACTKSNTRRVLTPSGAVYDLNVDVRFGRVIAVITVVRGTVSIQTNMRIGAPGTQFGVVTTVRANRFGSQYVTLNNLRTTARTCCGQRVFVTIIEKGCRARCSTRRRSYSIALRCARICFRRGTLLQMSRTRRCPVCR